MDSATYGFNGCNFRVHQTYAAVNPTDDDLYQQLRAGDERAFGEIYERYADRLYTYVYGRLRSHDVSFEITQELFTSLWMRRHDLIFHTSLSGYLFAATRYQMSRHIRMSKIRAAYFEDFESFRSSLPDNSNEETVYLHELEEAVERSLKTLPSRCEEIFRLSRQHNLTTQEIAQRLNISHKTVENQLTMALKHLRGALREFIVGIVLMVTIGTGTNANNEQGAPNREYRNEMQE
jgi:RNA polymerase sigma-70 factor (ECF subfamily)